MTLKLAKTALAGAALIAGLVATSAQAATLRWAAQNDVLTLDPYSQIHTTTITMMQHAYEGLTRYSAKYEVEPVLATKWTYISPTQVRFELRKNADWAEIALLLNTPVKELRRTHEPLLEAHLAVVQAF